MRSADALRSFFFHDKFQCLLYDEINTKINTFPQLEPAFIVRKFNNTNIFYKNIDVQALTDTLYLN